MIRYVLACGRGHTFEAWFRDGAGFVEQVEAKQVACPICGSEKVEKAPMAPNVVAPNTFAGKEAKEKAADPDDKGNGDSKPETQPLTDVDRVAAAVTALREYVEANATNVGRDFPEEARRMHYGEAEQRSIYGHADVAEARALRDEGIPCLRVPWGERRGN